MFYYRRKRSCGKVMCLHLSVILFTGVGGFCPGVSLLRGLCPGGSLSGGSLSRHASVQGGLYPGGILCPGVSLSRGVSVQVCLCPGGLCLGGSLSRGSLSRRESFSRGSLSGRPPPPNMVKSGRYASYWNAFSLISYY